VNAVLALQAGQWVLVVTIDAQLKACFYQRCGFTVVGSLHNDSNSPGYPLGVCGISIALWELRQYSQQLELIKYPSITNLKSAQRQFHTGVETGLYCAAYCTVQQGSSCCCPCCTAAFVSPAAICRSLTPDQKLFEHAQRRMRPAGQLQQRPYSCCSGATWSEGPAICKSQPEILKADQRGDLRIKRPG
jgi:hypothetical protein